MLAGVRHEDVASLVPAAAGSAKNKGRGDSTGSADRSIKQCGIGREVPADHEAQGQKCSDDCRSQESEVADVRRTSAERRMAQLTRRPRRQFRVRRCANSKAWKPLESRPHHVSGARGRRCFAQDSAGMDGLRRKNSQGREPRTQE